MLAAGHGIGRSSRVSPGIIIKLTLLCTFVNIGISLAIPGPTLIYFERLTLSREDEVALIFSARAVGSLAGWLLGLLTLDMKNSFNPANLVSVGMFGLCVVNLLLPWFVHVWWVMCGFAIQGSFLAITLQGTLAYVRTFHTRFRPNWSQQLIFASLIGCVLAPFIALPFFRGTSNVYVPHDLTTFLAEHSRSLVHNMTAVTKLDEVRKNFPPVSPQNSQANRIPEQKLPEGVLLRRRSRSVLLNSSSSNILVNDSELKVTKSLTTPVLKVATGTTRPAMLNITTLQPMNYTHTSNTSTSFPQNTTTARTTHLVVVTEPPSLKKPSVIDAKHLNQDASSADGSQTASKMKQLGEERRMDGAAAAAAQAPPLTPGGKIPPLPIPQGTTRNVTHVTSTTPTLNLSISTSSRTTPVYLNNSAVVPMKSNVTENTTSVPPIVTSLANEKKVIVTTTTVPKEHRKTKIYPSLIREQDKHTTASHPIPAQKPAVTTTAVNQTTTAQPIKTKTVKTAPPVTAIRTTTPSNITEKNVHPVAVDTGPKSSSGVSTNYHDYIVQHRSRSRLNSGFPFARSLLPIQKVYLFVGAICLFTWLLTFFLTGWPKPSCAHLHSPEITVEKLRLRRLRSATPTKLNQDASERDGSRDRLLPPEEVIVFERDNSDSEVHSEGEVEESSYGARRSKISDPGVQDNKYVPLHHCVEIEETNEDQSTSSFMVIPFRSPPVPQWPQISWPSDAWLLLAEFFNSGLETAYGGFIHGFCMRYLLWSPPLACLITSLFWLGGLIGRVPCLFLVDSNSSPTQSSQTRSPTMELKRRIQSMLSRPASSSAATHWLLTVVRLVGAFLCVISAAVLTRLSFQPTERNTSGTAPSSLSRNYLIWLVGSLFIGMGTGISSSTMGIVVAAHNTHDAHRLQLAAHIGQLLVPSTLGYVHHMTVLWRYSCLLSGTTLMLGILLSCSLLAELLSLTVWGKRQKSPLTGQSDIIAEHINLDASSRAHQRSNISHESASSPVTLHTVDSHEN
ncbi:unnamed protein product [Calicophoron daubneyi]|uniref:Uncharacterized protein n=1 Tax=Calicophoron daubneyi TaxID=300641 RepID=A0AAV2TPY2_CALDB